VIWADEVGPDVLTDYTTVQRDEGYERKNQSFMHLQEDVALNDRRSLVNRMVRDGTRWTSFRFSPYDTVAPARARGIKNSAYPYNYRQNGVLKHVDKSNYTPLAFITSLVNASLPYRKVARDVPCDHSNTIFRRSGNLKNGTFYETPLFTARLAPVKGNTFGYVDLNTRPFEITLNSGMAYPRIQMSFVHEVLHVLMEMHKINLPHETLHELALMITNDLMPGVSALAQWTNNAQ
jgi:hypothetical protein